MNLIFDQFHFLRPLWLLLLPAAGLLGYLVAYRQDIRSRWKGIIAPHLLDALIVGEQSRWHFRPIHLVVGTLILGAIGLAGPTWERELSPFTEDTAPLVVVLDLSQSMDAIDIQPSRLERAKQKIRDLLKLRTGARTALFVYSGSAHMVLPLTEDASLMELFLASLSTNLMPSQGKDSAAAISAIDELLEREEAPGTILFLTDGIRPEDFPVFVRHRESSNDQIMVLGVGTSKGGPIRTGKNSFLTDSAGRRVTSRMDLEGFERLKSEAGVLVTSVSLGDQDVKWIQNSAQSHLQLVQQQEAEERWIDYGYFLTFPVTFLVVLWFRRGWTIRWAPSCVLLLNFWVLTTPLSLEIKWIDLFLTSDQQGRYAFERGDYLTAAERFEDPYWKGISLYRLENYDEATNQFVLLESAEAYFYLGNCYARLGGYPAAVENYEQALRIRTGFEEAEENRKLIVSLIEKEKKEDKESEEPVDPTFDADEVKFEDKGKQGKEGEIDQSLFSDDQAAEMWMRNIQTSPADYLRFKFNIQASSTQEASQ